MNIRKILMLTGAALVGLGAMPVSADTVKDFETISKAIGFINGGPSGAVTMDVLYDAGNADSAAHADEVVSLTSSGVGSKVKLTGKKISSVSAATSPVIFVARGASSMYGAALSKAASNGGLTVSTDDACLGAGCVMVVKTQPSVDILVSTAAAGQTGTEFASAFSMMITKK